MRIRQHAYEIFVMVVVAFALVWFIGSLVITVMGDEAQPHQVGYNVGYHSADVGCVRTTCVD